MADDDAAAAAAVVCDGRMCHKRVTPAAARAELRGSLLVSMVDPLEQWSVRPLSARRLSPREEPRVVELVSLYRGPSLEALLLSGRAAVVPRWSAVAVGLLGLVRWVVRVMAEAGLSHGDAHAGNIVWDGVRCRLIDWEHAAVFDPATEAPALRYMDAVRVADVAAAAALRAAAPAHVAAVRAALALPRGGGGAALTTWADAVERAVVDGTTPPPQQQQQPSVIVLDSDDDDDSDDTDGSSE